MSDIKKEFHDELFDLMLKQAYYVSENKEESPEISAAIKDLKTKYAKQRFNEVYDEGKEEVKHVKH